MLGVVDHFETDDFVYIVTKKAAGGDLLEYIAALGQNYLSEDHAQYLFAQLAIGVKDIHIKQIVHRDLKHMNIFLSNKSLYPKVQIADFGLACYL